MRILMLAQFYPPIIGGEERVVHNLSVALAARGHQVAVATLHHAGLPEYEVQKGVHIHRLRSTAQRADGIFTDAYRRHAPPAPDPETVLGLRRLMDDFRPEIVHGHNWIVYSYLPLKPFYRAPLVVSLHDYSLRCAMKRLMYHGARCSGPQLAKCLGCAVDHYGAVIGLPTAAAHWLLRAPAHMAVDMFLPISQAVAEGTNLIGSQWPYQVMPSFLPDSGAAPATDDADYLKQLPPDGFLMFAGDLSAEKGVLVLLEAYAGLKNAPPLVLIGRPISPLPAVPNVVVLNNWPHSAVLQAWQRCSVALAPSVWVEPFGLVVLEAMAAGRPVIASRTGGICDMIVDQESGWLVPPGDPAALLAAIEQVVASPKLRERLGSGARRRAGLFTTSALMPRIEEVYRALINPQLARTKRSPQPIDATQTEAAPDV